MRNENIFSVGIGILLVAGFAFAIYSHYDKPTRNMVGMRVCSPDTRIIHFKNENNTDIYCSQVFMSVGEYGRTKWVDSTCSYKEEMMDLCDD